MTTAATAIREAVHTRLAGLPGYASRNRTPVPQIQVEDLPALSVFIMGERLTPDGDDNAGTLDFESSVTLGVSVVRGFADPAVLDGSIDADVDAIEARLLTDPTFARFGQDALFEAVTGLTRRRLYPQDGETYLAELRLEITFRTRVTFEPAIADDFARLDVTARQLGRPTTSPPIRGRVTLPTL